MTRQLSLDEMKQIELDLLKEFDRLCKKHGLTYTLAAGTCLGALRHGGFIPWDDDIDVDMPRADYDRLWELYKAGELDTYCTIVSYRDKSSIHHFFKFCDPRTRVVERFMDPSLKMSVWIDVLPVENTYEGDPDIDKVYARFRKLARMRELAVGDPNQGTTVFARVAKMLLQPIAKRLDAYDIARQLEENARSINKTPEQVPAGAKRMCMRHLPYYVYPEEVFYPPASAEFEGLEVSVPHDAERYLDLNYGDWRTIPPESERPKSHLVEAYIEE